MNKTSKQRLSLLLTIAALLAAWVVWDSQQQGEEQDLLPDHIKNRPSNMDAMSAPSLSGSNPFALTHREPVELDDSSQEVKVLPQATLAPTPIIEVPVVVETTIEIPPPPKPTAPPFPYQFMGRIRDASGKVVVYLSRDDKIYAVSQGQVLQNSYRIEKITPTELVFTFLPLNETQTLAISLAN